MAALIPFASAMFLLILAGYLVSLAYQNLVTVRVARSGGAMELALLRSRIDELAEKRAREKEKAERTWEGFRKFVVARKVLEAKDTRSFYLEPHDRRPLPSFMPGQYLTFRLNVPGQQKPIMRCYSLSDSPRPDYFRVTIKRVGPPPNNPSGPSGVSSCYFHDELDEGDIIDVKAPAGQFFMDPADSTPAVLIGGGIGLTPVLSMLNAISEMNPRRDVWLFYGVRDKSEHAMADHLRRIAIDHPNIKMNVCYSDPTPTCRADEDYQHAERVSVDLFKKVLPSNAPHFYMCGPPGMMQAMADGLQGWGVPEERIHYEAFGPATVKKLAETAPGTSPSVGKFSISFVRSGKQAVWDGKSTLLEMAEAAGVKLDFGCRAGNCGTCLTAVKSGEVHYATPPGSAVETGSCLACVAMPKADVQIDA